MRQEEAQVESKALKFVQPSNELSINDLRELHWANLQRFHKHPLLKGLDVRGLRHREFPNGIEVQLPQHNRRLRGRHQSKN